MSFKVCRIEFYLSIKINIIITDYPANDPRNLGEPQSRQRICDEVIMAREYIIRNSHNNITPTDILKELPTDAIYVNFQRRRSKSRDALPIDKDVAYYRKQTTWETKRMRLIECVRTRKRNWFVGFDGKKHRMYLIEKLEWPGQVLFKFTALLETRARTREIYKGPRAAQRLFQYFLDQLKSGKYSPNIISFYEKDIFCGNRNFKR